MNNQTFPRMTFHSIRHALLAGLLLLAGACSQNSDESLPTEDELVEVDFLLSGYAASAGEEVADRTAIALSEGTAYADRTATALSEGATYAANPQPGSSPATRATTTPLAEGTTVRIFAIVAGQSTVTAQQTYYMKGGRLVPCTVDAVGKFVADAPSAKLSLPPATYNFCTITPAVEAPGLFVTVRQNMDFALSQTLNKTVAFAGIVPLEPLQRKCARVQLRVKRDDASTAITALSVKSATVTGFSVDQTTSNLGIFSLSPVSAGTKSATTTDFAPEGGNPLVSLGNLYLLPTVAQAFPVEVAYEVQHTILGIERIETYKGKTTLSVAAGKSYTLTATIAQEGGINLTLEPWKDENWSTDTGEGVYPYTINGNTVVWKDQYGGTRDAVHEGWFQTPDHLYGDPANSVAARLMVANEDAPWFVAWTETNYQCSAPWRRPTVREMQPIVALYNSGKLPGINTFAGRIHATSTYYPRPESATHGSYNVNPDGSLLIDGVQNQRYTRCVQDIFVGTEYPYVVNGRFIVSKDTGGTSGAALHANWPDGTPMHNNESPHNSVSARFEVGTPGPNGYWTSTNNGCNTAEGWRRPTVSEARLIGDMTRSKKLSIVFTVGDYHTATEIGTATGDNNGSYYFFHSDGESGNYNINSSGKSNPRPTLCVRDF